MSLMLAEPAPRKPPDTITATSYDLHGIRVLACVPDGKNLRSDRDAVELIAEAIQPAPRKPPDTITATSYDLHGIRVLACVPDGKNLRSDRDAVELIAEAIQA